MFAAGPEDGKIVGRAAIDHDLVDRFSQDHPRHRLKCVFKTARPLLDRFEVPLLGTIEPIPGVPPTGRQISALTSELKGSSGIIIYAPYQSPKAPKSLAGNLGWRVVELPLEPTKGSDGDGYLGHIGRWVDTLASAR
jgi:hypothetical protein